MYKIFEMLYDILQYWKSATCCNVQSQRQVFNLININFHFNLYKNMHIKVSARNISSGVLTSVEKHWIKIVVCK